MSKIKIAYLEQSHIYSGAESSLHSLIKYLDRDKFEPVIVFKFPLEHQDRYNDLECKKIFLSKNIKWWMGSDKWKRPIRGSDLVTRILLGFKLAILAKKNDIDIVHINLMKPNSFWWAWFTRLFGVKVVGHVRSDFWEWMPPAKLQKQCNAIICVSEYVKNRVLTKYNKSNAYTVYNPVEFNQSNIELSKEEARKELGFDESGKLISSIGLLSSQKGHDMAIRVFAKICSKHTDTRLMVAGGGSDEELQRLKDIVREEDIEGKVLFTEKQIKNIGLVYRASEFVFSLTSHGEAFGRVPFEAMSFGTSTIAPNVGAAPELIEDMKRGYLADPLNVDDILQKALFILENPEESNTILKNGQSYFKELLSPKNVVNNVEKIYDSL